MRPDDVCPPYVGQQLVRLRLAHPTDRLVPYEPIDVVVDWSACDKLGGVVLPLELFLTGPTLVEYRILTRMVPQVVTVTPREGGPHRVMLREMAHNRWTGKLRINVTRED